MSASDTVPLTPAVLAELERLHKAGTTPSPAHNCIAALNALQSMLLPLLPALLDAAGRAAALTAERDRLAVTVADLQATMQACDHERRREYQAASDQHAALQVYAARLAAERDALRAETAALRAQVAGHCERIAAQSEILSRRAERPQTQGET